MGSDGSSGAWHVKQAGGTVVIEDPETAMFPQMPASVSPSLVDARADLDSIVEVVVSLMQSADGLTGDEEDEAFHRLLDRIRERSAIDFNPYKPATIVRRLRGRMKATGSRSVTDYAALVETDAVEYERLIGSL